MSAPRIRKAWIVSVRGYDGVSIEYAATAGKARYEAYLSVSDCNDAVTFADIRVLRNRSADITLPPIPIEATNISKIALEKLLHACGVTREQPEKCGYRSHFYCSSNNPQMLELVRAGLMESTKKGWGEGDCYFHATPAGQTAAFAMCPLYRGDDFAWPKVTA
jgi:hypothetical protein